MLTQDKLKEELYYDPNTGNFYRLKTFKNTKKGQIAGYTDHKYRYGYVKISVLGKYYQAHRLAFLYMLGKLPPKHIEVDHIDHNTSNNVWNNLRLVNHKDNGKNQKKYSCNTSGITGITIRNNKYRVRIYVDGKHISIGTYLTIEDAIKNRKIAEYTYNFHNNHGS